MIRFRNTFQVILYTTMGYSIIILYYCYRTTVNQKKNEKCQGLLLNLLLESYYICSHDNINENINMFVVFALWCRRKNLYDFEIKRHKCTLRFIYYPEAKSVTLEKTNIRANFTVLQKNRKCQNQLRYRIQKYPTHVSRFVYNGSNVTNIDFWPTVPLVWSSN